MESPEDRWRFGSTGLTALQEKQTIADPSEVRGVDSYWSCRGSGAFCWFREDQEENTWNGERASLQKSVNTHTHI